MGADKNGLNNKESSLRINIIIISYCSLATKYNILRLK